MNDVQIKCFLAAAKYENFTKAAESIFLSQPVVGRHISNLEEELGFDLFFRERKTVKLTENGRLLQSFFLECSEKYDAVLDQIHNNLRNSSMHLVLGSVEGQRIGDSYSAAFRYLIDNKPDLNVAIKFFLNAEIIDAVKSGAVDAAIVDEGSIENYKDILDYKKILPLHTLLFFPISHPAAAKRRPVIDDFKNDRFIILSRKDSELTMVRQKEILEVMGISNFIEAPDISTMAEWVAAGIGITTLPENHKLASNPDVVTADLPEIAYTFYDVIAWNKKNTNPAIKAFCQILESSGFPPDEETSHG